MPFRSERQRRYLYAKHPAIARRWSAEEKAVSKSAPRFGPGGGGHGSRMTAEEVSKLSFTPVKEFARHAPGAAMGQLRTTGSELKSTFRPFSPQAKASAARGDGITKPPKIAQVGTMVQNRAAETVRKRPRAAAVVAGGSLAGAYGAGSVGKGWGADAAKLGRSGRLKRLEAIDARGGKETAGDKADHEHYLRAWRKFTNLQERSNAGEKISPMRSRSFGPLEQQLPGYGGRTGSNWEFNGNKRVRKMDVSKRRREYEPEHRRQRRLGMYQAGLGLGGAAGVGYGAHEIHGDTKRLRTLPISGGKSGLTTLGQTDAGKGALRVKRKPALILTGGLAALGGVGAVRHHAESSRGRVRG